MLAGGREWWPVVASARGAQEHGGAVLPISSSAAPAFRRVSHPGRAFPSPYGINDFAPALCVRTAAVRRAVDALSRALASASTAAGA